MTKENKKIKNATPNEYAGIQFRSYLEKTVYKNLLKRGIQPDYEGKVYTFWKGLKPTVPFYDIRKVRNKPIRKNHLNMQELEDMEYTPDFTFDYDGIEVIIEAKGKENDQFPIRKKLFRAYLETLNYPIVFAEIFTIKQLNEFMDELEKRKNEFKSRFKCLDH